MKKGKKYELTPKQRQVVDKNKKAIRDSIRNLMKAYRNYRNINPAAFIFMFQWQEDYIDFINKGYPANIDDYYLDENGRLRYGGGCF